MGWMSTGTRLVAQSVFAKPSASAGPSEQFMPTAFAPMAESVAAATSGGVPRKVRPSSSKVMVTKTGRLECSFAASSAARASDRSESVSSKMMSHPAVTAASTCSAKRA